MGLYKAEVRSGRSITFDTAAQIVKYSHIEHVKASSSFNPFKSQAENVILENSSDHEERRRSSKRQALDLDSPTPASESASPKTLPADPLQQSVLVYASSSLPDPDLHSSHDGAMESKSAAKLSRRERKYLSEKESEKEDGKGGPQRVDGTRSVMGSWLYWCPACRAIYCYAR